MATVLVFQHAAPETLGVIADALDDRGLKTKYVHSFLEEPTPASMDEFDALIIMGGPMGVYDQGRMPFLKAEMKLIEQALKAKKPILGICLGSQMLASVLGSNIVRRKEREIGWHRVRLSEQGIFDPLLKSIEPEFMAFHWHRDIFDLPQGAVSLVSSDMTEHQAFRSGDNAYGFLCHMEITENMIREMIRSFSNELDEERMDPATLMEQGLQYHPPLERIGKELFGRWAELLIKK